MGNLAWLQPVDEFTTGHMENMVLTYVIKKEDTGT